MYICSPLETDPWGGTPLGGTFGLPKLHRHRGGGVSKCGYVGPRARACSVETQILWAPRAAASRKSGFPQTELLLEAPHSHSLGAASPVPGGYGVHYSDDCIGLLSCTKQLTSAPRIWSGKCFGAMDKRGWLKTVGSGRFCDDWEEENVESAQDRRVSPHVSAA
jgi:hypothetical protein